MNDSVNFPGFAAPHDNIQATRDGRRTRPLYYDVDLSVARSVANGSALVLNLAGNTLYIDQNPNDGNAVVHFQDTGSDNSSTPFYVTPGFIAQIPFTQVVIENAAQAGKKIRLIYGQDVQFVPNLGSQITIGGVVSVVDGGKTRTMNGTAFTGNLFCPAGGAGFTSSCQLFNPANSGVNVVVEQMSMISQNGAQTGDVRPYSTLLATQQVAFGVSKKSGGAGPKALAYYQNNANINAGFGNAIATLACPQTSARDNVRFTEPLVLLPGAGIFIICSPANNSLWVNVEWYEE